MSRPGEHATPDLCKQSDASLRAEDVARQAAAKRACNRHLADLHRHYRHLAFGRPKALIDKWK